MSIMLIRLLISCIVLFSCECLTAPKKPQLCLTGYMTDVQSWVNENGILIVKEYNTVIDVSASINPVEKLGQKMSLSRHDVHFKYLSMARCRLSVVPSVFLLRDRQGVRLSDTLQYMTFYGNDFSDISPPGLMYEVNMNATNPREKTINSASHKQASATWSKGFSEVQFIMLKELDLRACSIQILTKNIFKGMLNLESLYIGENKVFFIDNHAFAGLHNLKHLDFSKNLAYDEKGIIEPFTAESFYIFESMKNLLSLDMSFTKLSQRHVSILNNIGSKLTRLSLCKTGLTDLGDSIFNGTSLKILDLSGNYGIFRGFGTLRGLEKSLEVLYARDTGLHFMDVFHYFEKLEVLDLSNNEVSFIECDVTKTLKSLKILNLDFNRVTSWFFATFSCIPTLRLLSLKENNINILNEIMIEDIAEVNFVALSGNFFICNCYCRDFFDIALRNEQKHNTSRKEFQFDAIKKTVDSFHTGFQDFNNMLMDRIEVSKTCEEGCSSDIDIAGNFLLLDYRPSAYMCLRASKSKPSDFANLDNCIRTRSGYDDVIESNIKMLFILLTIPALFLLLIIIFIFRRNFRYCLITIKNSAMLSIVHKHEYVDDNTIFHYDVFVSYCNDDRNWVLDHLLPHLEVDCNISACLHERDFQVGDSILENIVSCMDRSRSIMLVISKGFLMSKWCQFEMHLAQHRLLETRREDLTLILLEEIPRRLRPNTLHYLMLTKTYIVWPSDETERDLFWRRVKKKLITMKQRETAFEADSLA